MSAVTVLCRNSCVPANICLYEPVSGIVVFLGNNMTKK